MGRIEQPGPKWLKIPANLKDVLIYSCITLF